MAAYSTPQMPVGVNPVDYMNYLARLQSYQDQQSATSQRQDQELGRQQFAVLMSLIQDAQNKHQQAYDANALRRNQILEGRTDTRNRVLDQWNQYGDSIIADTNKGYDTALKNSIAALNDTGLLASTVQDSMRRQNETARLADQRRNKDSITSNYATTDERLSNEIDAFNERIVDSYPDTSNLASLAAQAGGIIPGAASAYLGRPGAPGLGGSGGLGPLTNPYANGLGGYGGVGGGFEFRSRPQVPQFQATPAPQPTLGQMRQADTLSTDPYGTGYRSWMANLHYAYGKGGMEGEDLLRQVLNQGVRMGYANFNPNVGTPKVPVFPFMSYGGGQQQPQQQQTAATPPPVSPPPVTRPPSGYMTPPSIGRGSSNAVAPQPKTAAIFPWLNSIYGLV